MTNAELDPRVVHTRQLVLQATAELLVDHGFERITIEAIAERTGVARSTIYRNWPNRDDLYAEAFDRICSFDSIPDLGSLPDELELLAAELVAGFSNAAWGAVLPSLLGAVAHDARLAAAHRSFADRRRAVVSEVFTRAAQRDEISGSFPPDVLASTFAAGFFFHHVMARLPLDDAFVTHQIKIVMTLANAE
ncbi:MAG: TetR/AcrR family transcriptional regulator [bacterium]|nr:TetR/AcrR family transcriptional regulator [bacterium]MCP5032463.1 TetR/AcrR family transcriptional regulator [Actinomycetes bacterium]